MSSSKLLIMIAAIALILLFVFPIQSMVINDDSIKLPTRHKRWTFNTWRLHGRRQLSNDFYLPTISNDDDHQYDMFNNDDSLTHKMHEHISQFFRDIDRK